MRSPLRFFDDADFVENDFAVSRRFVFRLLFKSTMTWNVRIINFVPGSHT